MWPWAPRALELTCGQAKAGLEPLDEVSNIITVTKHLLCAGHSDRCFV